MRDLITKKLPICFDMYTIREMNREDFDLYAKWPDYPEPYEHYNSRISETTELERTERYSRYILQNDAVMFSVDYKDQPLLAKISFIDLDTSSREIKNMSLRLHPEWCGHGHGTVILKKMSEFANEMGFDSIAFDVKSDNRRAIKSYVKAGYCIAGEHELNNDLYYWMKRTL